MSRSSVASIAIVAAAVTGAVMWLCRQDRNRRPREEEHRWEGEGGNVPDVAVQAGNQGNGKGGRPAVSQREGAIGRPSKADEPWPFPRS